MPTLPMDYQPRYAQPFTLRQAISLDVSVITEGKVERKPCLLLMAHNSTQRLHVFSTP